MCPLDFRVVCEFNAGIDNQTKRIKKFVKYVHAIAWPKPTICPFHLSAIVRFEKENGHENKTATISMK